MSAILVTVHLKIKHFIANEKLIKGDGVEIEVAFGKEKLKKKDSPYRKCNTAKAALECLVDKVADAQDEARRVSGEIKESKNSDQVEFGLTCFLKDDTEFYCDEFMPLANDPMFQACFSIAVEDPKSSIPKKALVKIRTGNELGMEEKQMEMERMKETPLVIVPQLAQILSTVCSKVEIAPKKGEKEGAQKKRLALLKKLKELRKVGKAKLTLKTTWNDVTDFMEEVQKLFRGDDALAKSFRKYLELMSTKDGSNQSYGKLKDACSIYTEFKLDRMNKNIKRVTQRDVVRLEQATTTSKPKGLYNHINSCYMSSSLQCLSAASAGDLVQ